MPAGVRYPTPPAPGEPIRATLLRDIIDCLKRITPIQGKNTTVDYGSYGARVNGTPAGSSSPSAPGNPLFAIGTMDNPDAGEPVEDGEEGETEPEKCKGIVNCYFMRGGILDKVDDFKWDEENWKNGFLAFQIWTSIEDMPTHEDDEGEEVGDYPKIEIFRDLTELCGAQANSNIYTYPLYKLNEDGGVELDLRSVINIQLFEPVIRPLR